MIMLKITLIKLFLILRDERIHTNKVAYLIIKNSIEL